MKLKLRSIIVELMILCCSTDNNVDRQSHDTVPLIGGQEVTGFHFLTILSL
jgi:hypothetical protein